MYHLPTAPASCSLGPTQARSAVARLLEALCAFPFPLLPLLGLRPGGFPEPQHLGLARASLPYVGLRSLCGFPACWAIGLPRSHCWRRRSRKRHPPPRPTPTTTSSRYWPRHCGTPPSPPPPLPPPSPTPPTLLAGLRPAKPPHAHQTRLLQVVPASIARSHEFSLFLSLVLHQAAFSLRGKGDLDCSLRVG